MTEVSIYTEHRMAEGESPGATMAGGTRHDILFYMKSHFVVWIVLRGQAGRPRVAGPVQSTGCKSELVVWGSKKGCFLSPRVAVAPRGG